MTYSQNIPPRSVCRDMSSPLGLAHLTKGTVIFCETVPIDKVYVYQHETFYINTDHRWPLRIALAQERLNVTIEKNCRKSIYDLMEKYGQL